MLKAAPAYAAVWESQGCCSGQEVGVQNYHHERVMEERAASQKLLLLSPDSHHTKERAQPAWIFFRALPQLGGRSRQALALLPWARKFNSARPTKKMSELAMLKQRSGSSLGSFKKITATIMATTN